MIIHPVADTPDGLYLDRLTGEVVAESHPRAVWLDAWDLADPGAWPDPERLEYGDRVTAELARLDGEVSATRDTARALRARLEALEAARRRVVAVSADALARLVEAHRGRARSVRFRCGRAGWRRPRTPRVHDREGALDWASEHAPDALRVRVELVPSRLPREDAPAALYRWEEAEWYVHTVGLDAGPERSDDDD